MEIICFTVVVSYLTQQKYITTFCYGEMFLRNQYFALINVLGYTEEKFVHF